MNTKLWIVAAGALLTLAACGGGGSSQELAGAPSNVVPDSALSSSQAFSQWVGARMPDESMEPLTMNSMPAPTSATDEPIDFD